METTATVLTKRRDCEACISNWQREQETTDGTQTAAASADSSAEARAAGKVAKYALNEASSYEFPPHVAESYGCHCSDTHMLVNLLVRLTVDSGSVAQGAWLEGTLRRLPE